MKIKPNIANNTRSAYHEAFHDKLSDSLSKLQQAVHKTKYVPYRNFLNVRPDEDKPKRCFCQETEFEFHQRKSTTIIPTKSHPEVSVSERK